MGFQIQIGEVWWNFKDKVKRIVKWLTTVKTNNFIVVGKESVNGQDENNHKD